MSAAENSTENAGDEQVQPAFAIAKYREACSSSATHCSRSLSAVPRATRSPGRTNRPISTRYTPIEESRLSLTITASYNFLLDTNEHFPPQTASRSLRAPGS